jgi:hypothetical protein
MDDEHSPLTKLLIILGLGASAWAVFAIFIWWVL